MKPRIYAATAVKGLIPPFIMFIPKYQHYVGLFLLSVDHCLTSLWLKVKRNYWVYLVQIHLDVVTTLCSVSPGYSHWLNVVLIMVQHLRYWSSIKTPLCQCPVFSECLTVTVVVTCLRPKVRGQSNLKVSGDTLLHVTSSNRRNPLSPHDSSKHYFASLKNTLMS